MAQCLYPSVAELLELQTQWHEASVG